MRFLFTSAVAKNKPGKRKKEKKKLLGRLPLVNAIDVSTHIPSRAVEKERRWGSDEYIYLYR